MAFSCASSPSIVKRVTHAFLPLRNSLGSLTLINHGKVLCGPKDLKGIMLEQFAQDS